MIAVVIILIGSSALIYIILTGTPETSSSETTSGNTSPAYIITFMYGANPVPPGQNQSITIRITQGSYAIPDVSGALYVVAPNHTYYQTFGYTTDADGEASFNFATTNATAGTYSVFATILSLGEVLQNTSSSFKVG